MNQKKIINLNDFKKTNNMNNQNNKYKDALKRMSKEDLLKIEKLLDDN